MICRATAPVLALGAALLTLAVATPAWIRVAPILLVLVVTPGAAFARHIGHDRGRMPAALVVAVGTAWLVLSSEALIYSRWWRPAALIPASMAVSALALLIPARWAAHRVRWRRRTLVACFSIGATLVAVEIWAMVRLPYSAEELGTLQAASNWSHHLTVPHDGARLSALSLLQSVVIPFGHPSTGTLLATRWLGLGLLLGAVAAAIMWGRVIIGGRYVGVMAALVAAAAASTQVDGLSGVSTVGAPLLLGAGWCLSLPVVKHRRAEFGGVLLGASALCSRQCAVAGVGLLVWASLQDRQRRRASGDLEVPLPAPRLALGVLAALAVGALAASGAGVTVPALLTSAVPGGVGSTYRNTVALLALFVPFLLVAQTALRRKASTVDRAGRWIVGNGQAPMFALVGAVAGALLENTSLIRVALLPMLLIALSAASVLGSERHHRTNSVDISGRSVLLRLGVAAVIATPIATTAAHTWPSTNRPQLARIAANLTGTPSSEAVFDPTRADGATTERVKRSLGSHSPETILKWAISPAGGQEIPPPPT